MKKDKNKNPEVENMEDVEPVHFSKGAVWGILIGLCVILLLIFMVIYTAPKGGRPKVPTQSSKVENVEETGSDESSKSVEEETAKQSETGGNSEEVTSASSEETNSGNQEETEPEVVSTPEPVVEPSVQPKVNEPGLQLPEGSSLIELQSVVPAMGSEVSSSGIVSGMSMFKYNNSYIYCINIVLVTGNDSKVECSYFCPKNTYSALGIGSSINVIYQMDSMGNISISSISN